MIFFDEGWKALEDDYFQDFINNLSRTPRKKNNIFGLATQVANDTVNASISKAINDSAFTKFFFPNPSADRNVYINDLGLSEYEYDRIKTLPDDQHYFLLNHGRGINKTSVILRLNLTRFKDLIAIISAREETLAIFDRISAEVGDNHNDWFPKFLEQIHLR
jgi:type IV secretion system protein VirB4